MKVNTVDNQNFNGRFIIMGTLPKQQEKIIDRIIRKESDNLLLKPYDMYIRASRKGGILFSTNEKFSMGRVVNKADSYENLWNGFNQACTDAGEIIDSSSAFKKILYILGLKKFKG